MADIQAPPGPSKLTPSPPQLQAGEGEGEMNMQERQSMDDDAHQDQDSLGLDEQDADEALEVDTQVGTVEDTDSEKASSDGGSNMSVKSLCVGFWEHGRRYQSVRAEESYTPCDEQQWAAMDSAHLYFFILDAHHPNPFFRSPISPRARHIIDLGTGPGTWALDMADYAPNITIRGVDLYPPPHSLTAPNCIFDTDDITQPWMWNIKFDLVHMRNLVGEMSNNDWKTLYQRIYDNTAPGGWVEHVDQEIGVYSDDGTLPASSLIARFKEIFLPIGERAGRPLDTYDHMRSRVEDAGFINVHVHDYKLPLGTWPKRQVYKDAGRACLQSFKLAMEGWVIWLLTKHALPPFSPAEVTEWVAKVTQELDAGYHIYNKARRVWAQKPYDVEHNDRPSSRFSTASTL